MKFLTIILLTLPLHLFSFHHIDESYLDKPNSADDRIISWGIVDVDEYDIDTQRERGNFKAKFNFAIKYHLEIWVLMGEPIVYCDAEWHLNYIEDSLYSDTNLWDVIDNNGNKKKGRFLDSKGHVLKNIHDNARVYNLLIEADLPGTVLDKHGVPIQTGRPKIYCDPGVLSIAKRGPKINHHFKYNFNTPELNDYDFKSFNTPSSPGWDKLFLYGHSSGREGYNNYPTYIPSYFDAEKAKETFKILLTGNNMEGDSRKHPMGGRTIRFNLSLDFEKKKTSSYFNEDYENNRNEYQIWEDEKYEELTSGPQIQR